MCPRRAVINEHWYKGVNWTVGQILELAPDASSEKAGRGLAKAAKWSLLGRDDRALWGEISGSGKKPYQTRIDLSEPAFKCSCPSRKFPCKHSLGLFLIFGEDARAFAAGDQPDWVAEWLAGRDSRDDKKAERAEKRKESAADPEAQAKRAASREKKIAAGLDELEIWLADLLRRGFAGLAAESYSFWDGMAARLVDSQAPGLGRQVRELGELVSSGDGWEARLLSAIARLHLITRGYRNIEGLEPGQRDDLRAAVGWTVNKDDLAELPGVADEWVVLGQRVEEEDRIRTQWNWLWGMDSGCPALILNFAAGNQPLDASMVTGTRFRGELVFYPGGLSMRALIRDRTGDTRPAGGIPAAAAVPDALRAYGAALAQAPWLERWPMTVGGVRPMRRPDGAWLLLDESGAALPIDPRFPHAWELLSIGGGDAIDIFGEWSGDSLYPLSACAGDRFFVVGRSHSGGALTRVA